MFLLNFIYKRNGGWTFMIGFILYISGLIFFPLFSLDRKGKEKENLCSTEFAFQLLLIVLGNEISEFECCLRFLMDNQRRC